jgi:hypothetical protein
MFLLLQHHGLSPVANYVSPPAGATYPGSPDLFRAAARAAGDTFLATVVSKIRLLYPAFLSGFFIRL